jgi:aconitate hydratase
MTGGPARKTFILWVADSYSKGGTGAIVEYFGDGADSLSATGKQPSVIWARKLAPPAHCSLFDDKMAAYLKFNRKRRRASLAT